MQTALDVATLPPFSNRRESSRRIEGIANAGLCAGIVVAGLAPDRRTLQMWA